MLDRGQRRSPGASLKTGNGDMVGTRLGHTGRNSSYADFRHQFDRHSRFGIHVLQIMDQLRQVLDRIDVMVRWR